MKNQQENSAMTATHLNANENIVEASKKMTQPVRRLSPKNYYSVNGPRYRHAIKKSILW